MGAGAGLLDYDRDGDLDVYLVQGARLGRQADPELRDRLFRNDSQSAADGSWRLRFVDVTERSGLVALAHGMGVAAGDYDNDGWPDLYVTNFGSNRLFRNRGDGTFEDVTAMAGVDDRRWSVSATFVDYDRDGWLDLFVGNYVDFTLANHKVCPSPTGVRDYCGPVAFEPETDRLFHNEADGTFHDRSGQSGIGTARGANLGAIAADFDGDGWVDIYAANDQMPNQLWINRGDGTFNDEAPLAGCGVNRHGSAEASMGTTAEDYDNDGDIDLLLTHLTGETNTLYVNSGRGVFTDRTLGSGLGRPSLPHTGFGTAFLDYDNDGLLDLLAVNGAVKIVEVLLQAGDPFPYHQPNQLFRNLGGGRFEEVTDQAGDSLALSEVSRGAAFGDLDNDGDVDALISNENGPARLLINQLGHHSGWLGLRLETRHGAREAYGAGVTARLDDAVLHRRVRADGSYGSTSDPRVLIGLGDRRGPADVRVVWADRKVEVWADLPATRYTTLRQGRSRPIAAAGR
ncbi:MAG: CRTAC1 family protein [Thermoanaerobaculia bacterium]